MPTFRAMNTEVVVAAPDLSERAERALARAVEALFRETERRFSRFLPDSELAQLNRAATSAVSDDLLALLLRARAHTVATGGVFEPAVGAALHAAGYDRSFAPGALDRDEAPRETPYASIAMLDIDARNHRVTRPPQIQIDFGGFLKGLTVDRAAALAPGAVVVDAGGDAALRGAPWTIEIEDPDDAARTIGTVIVRDGAVATSAANRRRWRRGTQAMHHLVDPGTRLPARSDVVQATVLAPTAEEADVMAKVAFVVGSERALRDLGARGLRGVLVLRDGAVRTVGAVELHHA